MELLYTKGRMDSVSIVIRNSGIGRQRKFKGTVVIGQHHAAVCQNFLFILGDCSLQSSNFFLLRLDFRLVFLNRLCFIVDICFVADNILVFLGNQYFQICLFLLHTSLGFIQNFLFQFQILLT